MRVHYFQHVAFEGLGSIADWIDRRAYEAVCTPFYEYAHLPALEDVDFLIVMGGPMSVNDEEVYPWLVEEKQFVKQAIDTGIPVLGICLGAQIIASALGARVYPNKEKEIGWFDIHAEALPDTFFSFPTQQKVFHWHGETFDLPEGAQRLASSLACVNQAFQYQDHVLALQFHLETTVDSAQSIIENCRDELVVAPFIQSESQLCMAPVEYYSAVNGVMDSVLDFLAQAGKKVDVSGK